MVLADAMQKYIIGLYRVYLPEKYLLIKKIFILLFVIVISFTSIINILLSNQL